ncbi:MAG: aspartate kinase, partial [Acidobacteriaceae bacterium]|nr:aspartate kinase [Acidobacteriaceae bacterium]
MKFGGTSVEDAKAMERTATIVRGRVDKGLETVVVVSAMSKVTDQLLAAAAAAGRGDKAGALALSARLRHRHIDTLGDLLKEGPSLVELQTAMHQEFDKLDELLRGISAVGELTARSSDKVVSYGERLSSRMMAAKVAAMGMKAAHVDARSVIITDANYGKAAPLLPAIEAKLREHVLPLITAGQVPVMGGFIASTEDGVTTTLGRGGSDFTAALVGGGLHAGAIEIWTDVDGIMTTDPRICRDALRVKSISFEEAAELAYFGAKVLHPATTLPAMQKNIPEWVQNSRNPANSGTKNTTVAPS